MIVIELLAGLVKSVIWFGAYAQLLGIPVAWLRLRRTTAWTERPDGLRRIDLLAAFILGPTALTVVWGWLILAVAALGGLGFSGTVMLILAVGAPALFVPWTVAQLDLGGFAQVVARAEDRSARKSAKRQRG